MITESTKQGIWKEVVVFLLNVSIRMEGIRKTRNASSTAYLPSH